MTPATVRTVADTSGFRPIMELMKLNAECVSGLAEQPITVVAAAFALWRFLKFDIASCSSAAADHLSLPFVARKLVSAELTSSAWVQVTQCGPSLTSSNRAPSISLAVRAPDAEKGTIRSASP